MAVEQAVEQSHGQEAAAEGARDQTARAPVLEVLEVRGVTRDFRDAAGRVVRALEGVSLYAGAGEFVAPVGPSGAGKSTLLAIVAGLEPPTAGEVALEGNPAARRLGRVGSMPQRDLLLPWRTALGNAIAGLQIQGIPRAEARAGLANKGKGTCVEPARTWRCIGPQRFPAIFGCSAVRDSGL